MCKVGKRQSRTEWQKNYSFSLRLSGLGFIKVGSANLVIIVAIVAAVIVALLIICAIVIIVYRRKKKPAAGDKCEYKLAVNNLV